MSTDTSLSPCTDSPDRQEELVARVRARDPEACEELVRLAAPRMLAVARRMLPREQDAQDAVQEAFLQAFRSIERLEGRSKPTTWLHRIVVNACLMKLRSQRRKPERPISEMLPRFAEDGHQETPSTPWTSPAASDVDQAELRRVVREKIAELPETYRVVLMLRDIEGASTETTAELLGLTEAALKTRLHRARQALRELLDPYMTGATARA